MTRDELVRAVKLRLRIGNTGEGLLTDGVLVEQVNQAIRKFSRDRAWPWLQTSAPITIGTDGTAALPPDALRTRQVVIGEAIAEYVGFDEFLASSNRGVWTDDGNKIRFDPSPQNPLTVTLWYQRYEPDLANGTDEPEAPSVFHDLIVIWAAVLCARIRRDYELADTFSEEYARELAVMRDDINRKSGQRHRVAIVSEQNRSKATW